MFFFTVRLRIAHIVSVTAGRKHDGLNILKSARILGSWTNQRRSLFSIARVRRRDCSASWLIVVIPPVKNVPTRANKSNNLDQHAILFKTSNRSSLLSQWMRKIRGKQILDHPAGGLAHTSTTINLARAQLRVFCIGIQDRICVAPGVLHHSFFGLYSILLHHSADHVADRQAP